MKSLAVGYLNSKLSANRLIIEYLFDTILNSKLKNLLVNPTEEIVQLMALVW